MLAFPPVDGLGLVGAPNMRDLGGLVGVDGRRVRSGRLFRASALGRLTDADVEVLRGLDLRTVIELRGDVEVDLAPPDRLPEPVPEVAVLPVFDAEHPVFLYVGAVLLGEGASDDFGTLVEEGSPAAMAALYRWLVHGSAPRANFGTALRLLANPGVLPALVHCSAGKDRTGWFTTVVLTILGVSRSDIEGDYLSTNVFSAPVNQAIMAAMREKRPDLDDELVLPVLEARIDYLAAAYAEVEQEYGSFDRYLRDGLDLDAGALAAIRENLLH